MSLSAISTSGVVMGRGSIAISGNLYVRATGAGGVRVATIPVWSTPAEISATGVNNYAMSGSMIRLRSSLPAGSTIGGIDAYGDYSDKLLINVHPSGSGSITLRHQDVDSTDYNRFSLPGASGMYIHPYLSSSGCMVRVVYDNVDLRWKASTTTQK